jgi:1-aminocyclopropane-1-carboxylate deaminase/D-cysteine desulfhydrase-like pyridoxal-dependent ACC family enzyme
VDRLGFAPWAQEVAEQERELEVFFDGIVVCTVTGSTHAGMIAGFAGQDRHLVRQRDLGPDSQVLCAHLGGQPALKASSALFTSTERIYD